MRRIIQSTGVEVIHLGHDRSVDEVVNTAIQEDANAIALTSYQEVIWSILNTCMIC
jgi:methylmalonyl-CoA mutase